MSEEYTKVNGQAKITKSSRQCRQVAITWLPKEIPAIPMVNLGQPTLTLAFFGLHAIGSHLVFGNTNKVFIERTMNIPIKDSKTIPTILLKAHQAMWCWYQVLL